VWRYPRLLLLVLAGAYAQAAYAQGPFADLEPEGIQLGLYVLASLFVFFDLFDFLIRFYLRQIQTAPNSSKRVSPTSMPLDIGTFTPYQRRLHLRPYALVVSVYNLGEEVHEFVKTIAPYRDRLWVIDDASTDDTYKQLKAAGIQCIRNPVNRLKPGAIKELLRYIPVDIQTLLVLDPDSRILDFGDHDISDLETVVFEFQRSGMAALCPRITVRRDGWLTSLQRLEYWMAFALGRKSLGGYSITSGIAVYRRDMLERLMINHSLSVYAEDLENTFRLLAQEGGVYYDGRLVIQTEGKRNLKSWFSQRVGWSFGLIKVYTENLKDIWRFCLRHPIYFYQYVIYLGGYALLLHPMKLISAALLVGSTMNGIDALAGLDWVPDTPYTNIWFFPLAYTKYTLLALLAVPATVRRGERLSQIPAAVVYFFYALLHLVPMTLGYLNWFSLRLLGRRIYRDHYAQDLHINGRLGRNS
jgi:Glycosyltransferases, probably involved in cell wall biogenesis